MADSHINLDGMPIKIVDLNDGTNALAVASAVVTAGDIPLGQAAMAGSLPVVIANNQSAVPVSIIPPTTSLGITGARFVSADQSGSAAAVTDAPTAGQKLVLTDILVSVGATGQTVILSEQTSGTVLFTLYMAANSTFLIKPTGKLKLATADKKLMVQSSVAGAISVSAQYYSEA